MYELHVETEFAAAHAISINGVREPLHGHHWRVRATVTGETLDQDGLLCDFHLIERNLHEVVRPFHNHNLNETPPFDALNPTAELVAQHVARALAERLSGSLPESTRLTRVEVTEAIGCVAVFHVAAKESSRS